MPYTKKTNMKPLNGNVAPYKQKLQHNVEKAQKPEKINPKKIFENKSAKKKSKKSQVQQTKKK